MRNYRFLFIIGVIVTILSSCSKSGDDNPVIPESPDTPSTPTYPIYPNPNWAMPEEGIYECSMTAIVALPDSLSVIETPSDCLAVFTGDVCRGVAQRVYIADNKHVWMLMIMGHPDEDSSLSLRYRYWSSTNNHIYNSVSDFVFKSDTRIGEIDSPYVVEMNIQTE